MRSEFEIFEKRANSERIRMEQKNCRPLYGSEACCETIYFISRRPDFNLPFLKNKSQFFKIFPSK